MPSLGADMEDGTLVEWLKQPGDTVSRGDIVAVVETQKGAIEIEIFQDGVIDRLLVEPGQTVPVGAALALVNGGEAAVDGGEAAPEAPAEAPAPSAEAPAPTAAPSPVIPPPTPAPAAVAAPEATLTPGARLRISPVAARRASELGVDVRGLTGTGPGGAIALADVEAAAQAPAAAPPARQAETPPAAPAESPTAVPARTPREAMRRAIAAAMSKANREIPHYHLTHPIGLSAFTAWLEAANAGRPVTERLLPGVLLLKAVALALRKTPDLNGYYEDGAFRPIERVNVGWAISMRGGGLIAPAILDADQRPLDDLMAAMRDLVARARAGGLRSSELSQGTVTVTSLGDNGVETVHGVIYPPQVALVGFGRIAPRPWVAGNIVVPRPAVTVTLAADHRAGDGARGARFLNALDRILQEPETL